MNPPKPTRLKVLNGSAAHNPSRVNPDEPQPELGAEAPPWLPAQGPARDAWHRLYPILERMQVVTEADAEALALGCVALAEYLTARRRKADWRRAESAWKRYIVTLREFGLTPSSRTKVSRVADQPEDPLAEWERSGGAEAGG